jgi:hypothetical protein
VIDFAALTAPARFITIGLRTYSTVVVVVVVVVVSSELDVFDSSSHGLLIRIVIVEPRGTSPVGNPRIVHGGLSRLWPVGLVAILTQSVPAPARRDNVLSN